MRIKSSYAKYRGLSDTDKQRKAIEWCMRLLKLDIGGMSDSEFYDLVVEYECLVADPEIIGDPMIDNLGHYFFPIRVLYDHQSMDDLPDPEKELHAVRRTFLKYQKAARKIIVELQAMRDKRGQWLKFDTRKEFEVRIVRTGAYSVTNKVEHDFEFNYARRIVKLLNGRKFEDAIKTCPVCKNYFPILTRHEKKSCGHRCAMILNSTKKFEEDPEAARRKRNISSFFSVLMKRNLTDRQKISLLRQYIRTKGYEPAEIPRYIEKHLTGA